MKDDLLDAVASVDWAVSNFPAFQQRMGEWVKANVNVRLRQFKADAHKYHLTATQKEAIPLAFNVEFGAYINAIRSSLDILAVAIARRQMTRFPSDWYFPFAKSAADFASGNYKGSKFMQDLPFTERKILEGLTPYEGGDDLLWQIHHLDVIRKHKRLLKAAIFPAKLLLGPHNVWQHFRDAEGGKLHDRVRITPDRETVLMGVYTPRSEKPEFEFTGQIVIDEAGPIGRESLVEVLSKFAGLAKAIIQRFDY